MYKVHSKYIICKINFALMDGSCTSQLEAA